MRQFISAKFPLFTTLLAQLTCRSFSIFNVNSICRKSNPLYNTFTNCPIDSNLCNSDYRYFSTMAPVGNKVGSNIQGQIENLITRNKVMIFSKSWCPFCKKVCHI